MKIFDDVIMLLKMYSCIDLIISWRILTNSEIYLSNFYRVFMVIQDILRLPRVLKVFLKISKVFARSLEYFCNFYEVSEAFEVLFFFFLNIFKNLLKDLALSSFRVYLSFSTRIKGRTWFNFSIFVFGKLLKRLKLRKFIKKFSKILESSENLH